MLVSLRLLAALNTIVLRVARQIAWIALAIMVAVILLQVIYRYVLNNALAWPDEAARFLMLWMTGLMAPSAFRWSAFVSIDMFPRALPRVLGILLAMAFLVMSMLVLVVGIQHGYKHTFGFGGNFNSSSLKLPLDLFGGEVVKMKLRYMYMSLFVCFALMISVNVELMLRSLVSLFNPDADLPDDDAPISALEAD